MQYAWHIRTLVLLACVGALCSHFLAAPRHPSGTFASRSAAPVPAASGIGHESLDIADFGHPPVRVYDLGRGNLVRGLALDARGYLWAGTGDGAAVYNGRDWKRVDMPNRMRSTDVKKVVTSRDGGVWFLRAQAGLAYLKDGAWTTYDETSGLPSDDVGVLLETLDDSGATIVWVGTYEGLACFREGEWTTLELRGKGHNAVTALLETFAPDGTHVLWVGTQNGGVARYQQGQWSFFDTSSGLPSDNVSFDALMQSKDPEGSIWVGTAGGVARFQHGGWTAFTTATAGFSSDANVHCMAETMERDGSPSLWVGTFKGLARYHDGSWNCFTQDSVDLANSNILALLGTVDADGTPTLWVGTDNSLLRYRKGLWTVFREGTGAVECAVYTIKEIVSQDGQPELWVGTNGKGLMRLSNFEWTVFDKSSGLIPPSGNMYPQIVGISDTVADDDSRAMWVRTIWGMSRYEKGGWTNIDDSKLPADWTGVWTTTTAERGTGNALWLATPTGLVRYEDGVWTRLHPSSDPRQNDIYGFATSPDPSTLWVGTHGGVVRYQNSQFTFVGDTSGPRSTPNRMLMIDEDGVETLYFGTNAGLVRFSNGQQTIFDVSSGLPSDAVGKLAKAKTRDGRNIIWLDTSAGLARLEGDTITVVGPDPGLPDSPRSALVSIDEGERGQSLWVATLNGGAAWLDVNDPNARWKTLSDTSAPALPSNRIFGIVQDAKHRIYLVTNDGAAQLTRRTPTADDPSEFSVYTFNKDNVLPFNAATGTAVDKLGRTWFFTGAGAIMIDPSKEIEDHTPDPLYVERATLQGTDSALAEGATLAYDQNAVEFGYALLSYSGENYTRYQTRLVGFDEALSAWTPTSRRNYTNLPSGDYAFEVWGRDAAGNVSGPVQFAFAIRPAPWRTWWAYALYALLVAGAVYAAFRFRVRALVRRSRQLEGLVAARTAELEVSERRALAASTAKSTFLANMSHELRTPLNAVLGFAELLSRRPSFVGEERRHLSIITKSGEHLLRLIDDVLSIAKIEAGKVTITEAEFDLHRLVDAVEAMIRSGAGKKGIALVCEVDSHVPRFVVGDEAKLEEVLLNLLGNAVKFTEHGTVTLRARWEERDGGRAFFEVEDTGVGISQEEMGTLFDAFVQTASGRRAAEGTGLGLAISRQIVELMGGAISVRSELERGTIFSFDVRLARSAEDAQQRQDQRVVGLAAGQAMPRVLVVDDTDESRELLATLLVSVGIEVREASNGQEAVSEWDTWRPDLIFMDMRMPEMDGREATQRIRELERGDSPVHGSRIVVLSASAFAHEREEILASGADDFVTKPYREATIFEKLTDHLGVRFVCEETMGDESAALKPGRALAPERFAAWPAEEVAALERALRNGNDVAAARIVARQRALDEELAADVAERLKTFDFDEILTAMGRL